ncbi:hypothetical protein [Nocardia vinacea]|uniref:hypothetical protein n=1 Tax=Nocardia vinacea TaxID=96468 RepID=UPI0012F6C262|nr:hypothetical protein [Nocardia vinacea]
MSIRPNALTDRLIPSTPVFQVVRQRCGRIPAHRWRTIVGTTTISSPRDPRDRIPLLAEAEITSRRDRGDAKQARMLNPGAITAPGFGDLADGLVLPSNIY